jgi:hypothetical protein
MPSQLIIGICSSTLTSAIRVSRSLLNAGHKCPERLGTHTPPRQTSNAKLALKPEMWYYRAPFQTERWILARWYAE